MVVNTKRQNSERNSAVYAKHFIGKLKYDTNKRGRYFTASFNNFPGVNFGALVALILISSPV
mgnify:FL=1